MYERHIFLSAKQPLRMVLLLCGDCEQIDFHIRSERTMIQIKFPPYKKVMEPS